MKLEKIGIRVSSELKSQLQKLADEDKRKLSDFIRLELEKVVFFNKKVDGYKNNQI